MQDTFEPHIHLNVFECILETRWTKCCFLFIYWMHILNGNGNTRCCNFLQHSTKSEKWHWCKKTLENSPLWQMLLTGTSYWKQRLPAALWCCREANKKVPKTIPQCTVLGNSFPLQNRQNWQISHTAACQQVVSSFVIVHVSCRKGRGSCVYNMTLIHAVFTDLSEKNHSWQITWFLV